MTGLTKEYINICSGLFGIEANKIAHNIEKRVFHEDLDLFCLPHITFYLMDFRLYSPPCQDALLPIKLPYFMPSVNGRLRTVPAYVAVATYEKDFQIVRPPFQNRRSSSAANGSISSGCP